MKKILVAAAFALMLGMGAMAFAQTDAQTAAPATTSMSVSITQRGAVKLEGTLASISGTTLTVNSWGGAWSIDASSAKLVRRYGGTSSLSEFQTGDVLVVMGTAQKTGWAVTASSVRDLSIQMRSVEPVGTVSNVSGTAFTLTTQAGKTYQVTAGASTTVSMAGKTASWSQIANGMRAQVTGLLDRLESTITATHIRLVVARTRPTPSAAPSVTPSPAR